MECKKSGKAVAEVMILPVLFWSVVFIVMFSSPALSQTTILTQSPNHIDSVRSDAKSLPLPLAPSGDSVADNFILSSGQTIAQIRIWGVYAYGNTAPAIDSFTVIIHSDAAGLPGAALSVQPNVPVTRQVTGGTVGGNFTEYVYTLTPNPVILTPGTYWVEIYNDTTGDPDSFFWEFGVVDPIHGIPGAAVALTTPGINWQVLSIDNARQDLAIEITTQPPTTAVPTITGWAMVIMSLLLGGSGIYLLGRRRAI